MTHPTYLDFQSQIATLSLISQLNIKFLPPDWDAPTPQTPFPGSPIETDDTQQLKEWKRHINMYRKYLFTHYNDDQYPMFHSCACYRSIRI
jgi:hypothetical protein